MDKNLEHDLVNFTLGELQQFRSEIQKHRNRVTALVSAATTPELKADCEALLKDLDADLVLIDGYISSSGVAIQ